ncbi:CIA30 family protein [bacterium]|nr:CIA30 family protein [bacterium]
MRLASLLLLLLATCTISAQESGRLLATRTLASFADKTEGRRWQTVLDGVMGGRSTGKFRVTDGSMIFTGVLNTNGGGFSSVRRRGKDLKLGQEGEQGIHLRLRGDGRKYTLRLRQPSGGRRAPSYRFQFRTIKGDGWQDVFVPYAQLKPTWRGRKLDLPPVDPSMVDELGISIDDKIDGPFQIEIQKIATFAAFDIADYRGLRRPLIIFAASADDPLLTRQLAALQAAEDGLAAREMTLIVVLDKGKSYAGSRILSAADKASLRERFRDEAMKGGFAVQLVGKDGGVKRVSTSPLETSDLFAQIDKMPMRIREVRSRRDS